MHLRQINKPILILAGIGVVFFFIYSYLPLAQLWQSEVPLQQVSMRFNTPDEVINYYFTQQYTQTGQLYYFEPLDNFMQRVIFPRWALVVDGRITPGNFIGIDLIYGTLAKIFSMCILPFLTPIFAILGVLFFYGLVKKFFNKNVAFVSALLVLIFPGFWYYASRTMFHNVLFLSLLIGGLYFLIKLIEANQREFKLDLLIGRCKITQKFWPAILTGLFFGLALITRTSEICWIFLMVLTILIFHFKQLKNLWPYLLLSLIIFMACFVPVIYQHKILYGSFLATPYPLTTVSNNLEAGQVGSINYLKALILPFGFHPRVMVSVFYHYFLVSFWPWLIFWLAGFILFLKYKKSKEKKLYLILLLLVACFLFLYYGSWFFDDSPVVAGASLGSSYVRYFLPIYLFNLPLIAFFFVQLWQKDKIYYKIFSILIFCLLIFVSGWQVLFRGPESLVAVKNQLLKYRVQAQDLLEYVGENDIILLDDGTDKILFPERKHLIVPQDGVEWLEIKKILPYQKVYYFHHTEKADEENLNQTKFKPQGLKIGEEILIQGGGKLYKISN